MKKYRMLWVLVVGLVLAIGIRIARTSVYIPKEKTPMFHVRVIPTTRLDPDSYFEYSMKTYKINYTNDGWVTTHTLLTPHVSMALSMTFPPQDMVIDNRDSAIKYAKSLISYSICYQHDSIINQQYQAFLEARRLKEQEARRRDSINSLPVDIY